MKITPTQIPEIILFEPKIFQDDRGFFFESFQKIQFQKAGIDLEFVQDNHSKSLKNTLRGLHYQIQQAQGKLIRVIAGEIFDVAVDIRKGSSTFGSWIGDYLSAENKKMLWIPPGFAHGFYVTSPEAEVVYKATNYYAPNWERTIIWNDPTLNIEWPLNNTIPILSAKDKLGKSFGDAEVFD